MFKARPVSRVRARREALARDILGIHPDFLMAVYGYGKMHARPIARGWDPDGIGRRRGDGMRHASLDWHGRRLLWQRHGRERQRRVQDRTRLAAKPFRDLGNLELATFQWVSWRNSKRPHRPPDHKTPQAVKTGYYANQAAQAASL